MATRARRKPRAARENGGSNGQAVPPNGEVVMPGTTGRYLVLLREDAVRSRSGAKMLRDAAGLNVASSSDFDEGAISAEALAGEEAILFEDLGVAVVNTPPDQVRSLTAAAAEDNPIIAVEPERVVYAFQSAVAPAPVFPVRISRTPQTSSPRRPLSIRQRAQPPPNSPLIF